MADREKVIKWIESCLDHGLYGGEECSKCPYYSTSARLVCKMLLLYDAHELLKEQDAVEPIRSKDADVWYCGNCDAIVGEETLTMGGIQEVRYNYCPECGRKVKWDETDRR